MYSTSRHGASKCSIHVSFPEPSLAVIKLEGRRGGIPNLAKNERDMGHPAIVVGTQERG